MSDYRMDQAPPPSNSSAGVKVATGCGVGCLAMILIVGIVVYIGLRSVQGYVDDIAESSSTEERIEFAYPKVQPSEADLVIARFDSFRGQLDKEDEPLPEPLVLSKDDINILINHHSGFAPIAGKAMIDIIDDQIIADVSLNPEEFPAKIPFISKAFAGRYINGKAQIDFQIADGKAELYLLDFKFAEKSLPVEIMDRIREENLIKADKVDKGFEEFMEKIETMKIEDNQLHVVPRVKSSDPQEATIVVSL